MSLIQWRPKQEVDSFRDLFNNEMMWAWGNFPAIDVAEDKDKFTVKADLPGLRKEDIKVTIENGVLSIQGERKNETEQKDKNYYKLERAYGMFVRNIDLGKQVDTDSINAQYNNGVLEITIAKTEKSKHKAIEIK